MNRSALIGRAAEALCGLLLAAGFATIQTLIGGTRLLFSLPAYGLLALLALLTVFSLRRAKPKPSQVCLVSAAAFFGYVLVRAYFSPVDYIARPDIYSVLGGLVVYFFVACIFTESRHRMMLVVFLLALAMVQVFIGAIQFRDGSNFMLISFLQRVDYDRRASGFYVCPNHLAGLLEVLGIFGLSIVCWSRWPTWGKLLIGYATCICYVGVALTGSRGGYLSTAASLSIFALLSLALLRRASTSLFWRVGGPTVVAAALIAMTVVFFVKKSDYLSDRARTVFETTNVRVDMWQAALQQWTLRPAVGTGSGTYLFYGREFRTERVQPDPVYAHNDYLQLLAEYGALGMVLFAIFFGVHLRNGWRNLSRLGFKRLAVSSRLLSNGMAMQLGAIAAIGAYMIHSIFDFNLHIPANVLLLAFVFGVVANAGTPREAESASAGPAVIAWRLCLPLIGVILAIQCIRLLPGEYFAERARTTLRDNRPISAIFFALRGLTYERNNPNLYQYLGSARIEQAQRMSEPEARSSFYRAALEPFEKARALAPRDKTFVQALAFIYDALGRFEEAEWMYGQALALDPRSVSTRRLYEMHLEKWRTAGSLPGDKLH